MQLARRSPGSLLALLVRWLLRRRGRTAVFLFCWVVHYVYGVRRVRLHRGRGGNPGSSRAVQKAHRRLKRILERCPSLSATYWPPWFAHTACLQFLLLGFKEFRARVLQRSPYERELLALHDGGRIAVDWVPAAGAEAPAEPGRKRPVCVLLHGAVQDSSSVTMSDLARSLSARGMPVAVMNRRGYGGVALGDAGAKLSMFGFDEDLDDVLACVGRREPGRPVAVIGFSCGSGFAGRYVGSRAHLSAWTAGNPNHASGRPQLLCSVGYDPGYDVSSDGAVTRVKPPYSWVLNLGVKYCYAFRHRDQLRAKSASTCDLVEHLMSPRRGLRDTYKLAKRLSGAGDSSAWLDMQQPCLDQIEVPTLMVNSRDDPICVWENVEAFSHDIAANPNLALAELRRGAHGCKFGFWGFASVIDDMIGEFVVASWAEWCKAGEAAPP